MSESVVLLLAIIATAMAVAVSVALSIAHVAPPAARSGLALLPASVFCPTTGDVAFVEIGFNWDSGDPFVASCERYCVGALECGRECLPTRVLTPAAEGGRRWSR